MADTIKFSQLGEISRAQMAGSDYAVGYKANGDNKKWTFENQADFLLNDSEAGQEFQETFVKVQNTEPTDENNKIWIEETPENEVEVPTYDEFKDLSNLVSGVNEAVFNKLSATADQLSTYIPFTFSTFAGKRYIIKNESSAGGMLARIRQTRDGENGTYITNGTQAGQTSVYEAVEDADYIAVMFGPTTTNPAFSIIQDGDVPSKVEDLKSALINPPVFSIIRNGQLYGNMWDTDTKEYGYFENMTGKIINGGTSFYYSPTYIPVNSGDVINYNNTRPILCAYDINGNVVECLQPSWSGYTVPSGVSFLRFSLSVNSENGMCIFKSGTSQIEYKQKTKLYIPNLITEKKPIIVAADGDYVSLTEALYNTYEEHPDVIVKVGNYDIVAEYKALFGNDIFDTMTYETTGMKNYQWGIYIDNRTVTFMAGARVTCDMSLYTNDGSRRFSPFNLGENAVIDGLDCYAINPYYIIHDDFGELTGTFTNIIRNCKLVSPEPAQGNVIGGGCKMYSTKIVENCWLDNGNNRPVTMRYHNANAAGATPVVIIRNTRANGRIRLNYYGSQTTKMTAMVSGCKASAIEKSQEGSYTVDNVDLLMWCNEIG